MRALPLGVAWKDLQKLSEGSKTLAMTLQICLSKTSAAVNGGAERRIKLEKTQERRTPAAPVEIV